MSDDHRPALRDTSGDLSPIDGVASLMADGEVTPLSMRPHVSTGSLPPVDRIVDAMQRTLDAVRDDRRGTPSTVYPALASAEPDLVGIALAGVSGRVESVGDAHAQFTIMSVAKPFVFGLVGDAVGAELVRSIVGVNATGRAFNSAEPIERMPGGRTNPMVNAGAIATAALTPGTDLDERWLFLLDGMSRLAGRALDLDQEVLASALATNHRNRALGHLLYASGVITGDPDEAVELYTRQSCVALDVRDVATMGATIANGGRNPGTGDHVVDPVMCHDVMAVMATAGLYETSGDWLWDVGLPGKSGISGAVVALSPGKGAIAAFSPRLDDAGNSIRGQIAAKLLSQELGLDVFAARPE
jgi:glutaminase